MNLQNLIQKLDAIDKGQQLDEFLTMFSKKKEEPPKKGQQPPQQGQQPPQQGQQPPQQGISGAPPEKNDTTLSGTLSAIEKRKKAMSELEEVVDVEECGMGPMEPAKQMDNVNMNVSLNASGSGGIRDLLDILRDIEHGSEHDHDDSNMPAALDGMGMTLDDDFANESDVEYYPPAAMFQPGGDHHKEKNSYDAAAGGDNPMAHMERLENLYQQIKLREGSGPKEKQRSKYVDRSSDESKAKVQASRDAAASAEKAKPGKKLLSKINSK